MADRDTALARIRRIPLVNASVAIALGVALLQAYVFAILNAVYLQSSLATEH